MQTESNDCLAFHASLGSTNYAISQQEDDRNNCDDLPIQFRGKFYSQDLIACGYEAESIELDIDLDQSKQIKEQSICQSVMEWFQQKGITRGNPQQIWQDYNRELQKRTHVIIHDRNVSTLIKPSSSLLQRRLHHSMVLSL